MRTVAVRYGQPVFLADLLTAVMPAQEHSVAADRPIVVTASGNRRGNATIRPKSRSRRPIEQTRDLIANVRANNPQISQAEVARRLGISATRLRQVERVEVPPQLDSLRP
jgi:ribosome-binding protein aMBF1 (putative translation factor)